MLKHSLKYLFVFITLALSSSTWLHGARQVYTPETVPNVFVEDSLQLLSDPDGFIDQQARRAINEELLRLRLSSGVEFPVVILETIGDRDIESFATELFRLWGIGSKSKNDGLLLLIVIDQRKLRFEVGYGLEGTLPDALAAKIQRQQMIPLMRQGDYAGAILAGVQAVSQVISGEGYISDRKGGKGNLKDALPGSFGLCLYLILIGAATYSAVSSFHGKVKRLESDGCTLLMEQDEVKRSSSVYGFLLFVLCAPIGLLFLLYVYMRIRKLKNAIGICPSCKQKALHLVSQSEATAYLTPAQELEERLRSCHYQTCLCSHCGFHRTVGHTNPSSPYKECPNCGTHALEVVRREHIRGARGGRYIRTHTHCKYCNHDGYSDRRDPSDESAALGAMVLSGLMSGHRHRGGGSGWGGGGFSGGSFGGGSSGGGGATSGW